MDGLDTNCVHLKEFIVACVNIGDRESQGKFNRLRHDVKKGE